MAYSKKIGASRKSGMASKYGAKAGKRRAAPFGRVSQGTLTKAIKSVIARQAEVKYVASTYEDQEQVATTLIVPAGLRPVLPKQSQGVGPAQRIGDQIRGARGHVDLTFSLMNNYTSSGNYVVKVFELESKAVKDGQYISSLSPSTLLDVGDGSTTDWNPATVDVVILSQMPVSNSNFSVKAIKTLNLSKNSGGMNGDASTPPPSANGVSPLRMPVVDSTGSMMRRSSMRRLLVLSIRFGRRTTARCTRMLHTQSTGRIFLRSRWLRSS